MARMSPNDIEVLIHYHCCGDPHPRLDAPAVAEAVEAFLANGLIERCDRSSGYMTTARGIAHVNQLCALPWPEPAWRDAHGAIILDPWTRKMAKEGGE